MTRDDILKDIDLKEHFAHMVGLPLAVLEEPYFTQRLETLDPVFNCKMKFENFVKDMETFGCIVDYYEYYQGVMAKAYITLSNDPGFRKFLTECASYPKEGGFVDDEWINSCGGDMESIRIGMDDSFFTAMTYAVPSVLNGKRSVAEFMAEFTDMEHIIYGVDTHDKLFNCLVDFHLKNIQRYIYHLLNKVAQHITDTLKVKIGCIEKDYIAFEVNNENNVTLHDVVEALKSCPDGIGTIVHATMEKSTILSTGDCPGENIECYEINAETGEMECSCPLYPVVTDAIMPQVVKHFYGHEITDDDLVFHHKNGLVKFMEPIPNPWAES